MVETTLKQGEVTPGAESRQGMFQQLAVQSIAKRLTLRCLVFSVCLAAGLWISPEAKAMASVELCNDGEGEVRMVIVNNHPPSLFGSVPKVDGWWSLDSGDCKTTAGGMVDITVGFYPPDRGDTEYYDLPPPKLYKPGLMWVPSDEALVESSNRKVCADPNEPFERTGSHEELESCPDGWVSVPLQWHIWAYPSDDLDVTLLLEPSPDKIKEQTH